MVEIIFSKGAEVTIQETYPGSFSSKAESVVIMGQGFCLNDIGNGKYQFAIPRGLAQDAQAGDILEIYHHDIDVDGLEKELLATAPILSVDMENYDIWVELSTEEVRTFLAEFGFGIVCTVDKTEGEQKVKAEQKMEAELTPDFLLQGSIADGTYRVYARSLSRSARGIDRYIVDDIEDDAELLFLAFADDCKFLINEEMDSISYGEVTFEAFADLAEEAFSFLNPSMLLTFRDGLITEAILETYYGSGISYAAMTPPDDWYEFIQEDTGLNEEEVLAAYYTLADTVQMDIGDSEGMERIEVYIGNIGDGDSGIVLICDASGRLLYSESAHIARAGWNNIFLGEKDGIGYMMTVHIEDRDTYGEYAYQVFRLSEDGTARQIAGSSLVFYDDSLSYDNEPFAAWMSNLYGYLTGSRLALSTQDGIVRTYDSEVEGYDFISRFVR